MQPRWLETWKIVGRDVPAGLFIELREAYSQPHRAYHTMQHLAECFDRLDGCDCQPEDAGPFELAVWFHDVVYDPKSDDNEARSADWAAARLTMLDRPALDRVRELILITQHVDAPIGADQKLIVDLDLAILGAPRERFDEYERQIRFEYSWVAAEDYRKGRAEVLKRFLNRDPLYQTRYFQDRLEAQARTNLERSLRELGAGKA